MTSYILPLLNSWKDLPSSHVYGCPDLPELALSLETTWTWGRHSSSSHCGSAFQMKRFAHQGEPSALPPAPFPSCHLGRDALRHCQKLPRRTIGVTMWQHPKMKPAPQVGDKTREKESFGRRIGGERVWGQDVVLILATLTYTRLHPCWTVTLVVVKH